MPEPPTLPARTRRPAPARTAAPLSVGVALPTGRLAIDEPAADLGIAREWILSRTGVRERRRAEPAERLSDYAARAGAAALERADVAAADLDLVLVATLTADELTPNAAPLVAHAPGAGRAGALDVGAAGGGGGVDQAGRARRRRDPRPDDHRHSCAFGAGSTWGGALIDWGGAGG